MLETQISITSSTHNIILCEHTTIKVINYIHKPTTKNSVILDAQFINFHAASIFILAFLIIVVPKYVPT
jgi:hypothetical protein